MSEKDKPTVLLEYYLKKLRLPTMLREYASMAVVCQKDRTDFPTYLLRLVERELLDREKRAAERRVKDANFPVLKTLDTFDFKAQPSINEQLVIELMRGEYLDKRENVLLIGNPGTGKTHLATALGIEACKANYRTRFISCYGLVNELIEAREARDLIRLIQRYSRYDLLILDELGYIPFSKEGSELLFQVLAERYEKGSIMITTNLGFADWTQVFGDPIITATLLDRLTHRAHIIDCMWDSYRLKQSIKTKT